MCRIAGIIAEDISKEILAERVALMCQAQKHGGPDGQGMFIAPDVNLVFGHRRLAIIDLNDTGQQPMTDITGAISITFNGEIYNYSELKSSLMAAGVSFRTKSDTEVILQIYRVFGVAGFSKLRGMFAFALFDSIDQLTYLVRDTMGIKPLYYHVNKKRLCFASEVRAFQYSGLQLQSNPYWRIRFLAFGYVPEPDTTLKDVRSLPKGYFLCWDHRNRTHHIGPYQQQLSAVRITERQQALDAVNRGLAVAVKRQLIADAPIGVFLSGGIDSSIITLLADNEQREQLKAISLFFNEKAYDERAFQQQVSKRISGQTHAHLVMQHDLTDNFTAIMRAMDMPTMDGINSWFISRYARINGLKAVLSGIGGDELFGGYPSFRRMDHIGRLRKLSPVLLRTVKGLMPDRYQRLAYLENDHPFAEYLFLRGLFTPVEIGSILGCSQKEVFTALHFNAPEPVYLEDKREKAAWYETNLYMQNQLLRDTDVMSMCHGLEVRVPFLDEEFKCTVDHIDPAIRFDARFPKKILVDAFSDILPTSVWERPKMGFTFPLQQWLKAVDGFARPDLYEGVTERNIIKRFNADKIHWSKAFALYQNLHHV